MVTPAWSCCAVEKLLLSRPKPKQTRQREVGFTSRRPISVQQIATSEISLCAIDLSLDEHAQALVKGFWSGLCWRGAARGADHFDEDA